ncbi:hypothetical protein AW736_02495 [Termitidicoccus mucosus]|uniref:Type II/III secretion system secretin-like domain-containing protein n=1 Tax=Termitidicoccus mucosus TaxID=1184151 RepID=A0A178IQ89_9BACT|nr:hypothetical protein AW736_02495 [Opitutaceae bacterium TSB47]
MTAQHPNGIWVLRSMEKEGLIARTYRLKYAYGSGAPGGSGGDVAAAGASGGPRSGSVLVPATSRQFQSDGSKLQQELSSLLDLTERGLVVPGDTDYAADDRELDRELGRLGVPLVGRTGKQEGPKSRVLYSDALGTLFVAATRQQHEWVRGYLRAMDRPSRNIIVEVKFVETTKSPSLSYGIKWPQQVGVGFAGRNAMSSAQTSPQGSLNGSSATGGSSLYVPGTNVPGYGQSGVGIPIPGGFPLVGLLQAADLNLVLSALKEDAQGSNISYYYMLVSENQEMILKNTSQVPILAGSASVSSSTGNGTVSQNVEYRDVGLTLNVKPRIIGKKDIHLDLSFELSKINGYEMINTSRYPIPGVRSYQAPVTLASGASIAIGGLDELGRNTENSKVPVLGDIPLLGRLFRSKSVRKPQTHMLVFVTATVQDDYQQGVDQSRRGVFLGDWQGYYGGAETLEDLKARVSGLYSFMTNIEQSLHDGNLTRADAADVNALVSDLALILEDYDRIALAQAGEGRPVEDGGWRSQLLDWRRRAQAVASRL